MAGLFRMRKITIEAIENGLMARWWDHSGRQPIEHARYFESWDALAFQFSEPVLEARETPPAPYLTPEQEVRLQRIEATADSVGDEVPGPMCRTAAEALRDSVNCPDCE